MRMKTKQLLSAGAAALLGVAVISNANAEDAELKTKSKVGEAEGKASINVNTEHNVGGVNSVNSPDRTITRTTGGQLTAGDRAHGTGASDGTIREMNKASKLVGMDVKNQANEDVGEIHDVVIDLSSGRVSYVVLSVGGFLGVGEKYIAVPPAAFAPSMDDDNKLVLNVDKQRIQQATGFAKSEWPNLNNPEWGAAADWGLTNNASTGVLDSLRQDANRAADSLRNEAGRPADRLQERTVPAPTPRPDNSTIPSNPQPNRTE